MTRKKSKVTKVTEVVVVPQKGGPSRSARRRAKKKEKKGGKLEVNTLWGGGALTWGEDKPSKAPKAPKRLTRGARMDPGSVGNAMHTFNVQFQTDSIKSEKIGDEIRTTITGSDFLTTIQGGPSGSNEGDILTPWQNIQGLNSNEEPFEPTGILISPAVFPNSRIGILSQLFQHYACMDFEIIYMPACSTSTDGQLIGFCDEDASTYLPRTGVTNQNVAAAHQNQRTCQVWEPMSFPLRYDPLMKGLYVTPDTDDVRLSFQGVFYLLAATAIDPNQILGKLYLNYRIKFTVPCLNNPMGLASKATAWRASKITAGLKATDFSTLDTTYDTGLNVQVALPSAGVSTVEFYAYPGWKYDFWYQCPIAGAGAGSSVAFTGTGLTVDATLTAFVVPTTGTAGSPALMYCHSSGIVSYTTPGRVVLTCTFAGAATALTASWMQCASLVVADVGATLSRTSKLRKQLGRMEDEINDLRKMILAERKKKNLSDEDCVESCGVEIEELALIRKSCSSCSGCNSTQA